MWFVHHCIAWAGDCQPASWADLAEMIAGTTLAVVAILGFFLGLAVLGD